MEEMFKAHSKCKTNRIIFYVFEICALIVAAVFLIYGLYIWIYYTASYGVNSGYFFSGLMQIVYGLIYGCVLYGIGKVIDLAHVKSCCKKPEEEISAETEEKSDEE